MEFDNEEAVKEALGVTTWANASLQKLVKFAAILPSVSKDVALKVAEQLPEIRKTATRALASMEKAYEHTLKANNKSQKRVHEAYEDIRDVLKGQLAEGDLSWEQKKDIYDLLMDTGKEQFAKDSENKRALDSWLKTAGVVAVAALAACVLLVGAKAVSDED
jgi:predicted phage gp36 major capsid-like protein